MEEISERLCGGPACAPAGQRDNSLDLLRGLAALSVVYIHTAFWSGEAYVPRPVEALSLILDVPFFFFLSGWGLSFSRSVKKSLLSLVNIYVKFLVFWCMYVALLLVIHGAAGTLGELSATGLLGNLRFQYTLQNALPVVMGSIWFLPVYFSVMPVGVAILWLARRLSRGDEARLSAWLGGALALAMLALVWLWRGGRLPLLDQTRVFHLVFLLLGLVLRQTVIPRLSWAAGLIVLELLATGAAARMAGLDWVWMQELKVPPAPAYFFFSLAAVTAALWLRGKTASVRAEAPLCRIGRAALLFYFCQGIGGSVLRWVAPRIHLVWYCKLPLAFCLNLAVTVSFVWVLSQLYRVVFHLLPAAVGRVRPGGRIA